MKKNHKILLLLTMVTPLFFTGCQKSETPENAVSPSAITSQSKTDFVYCGTPLVVPMKNYNLDQALSLRYATLTIGNDETSLLVRYEIDDPTMWYISNPRLFVGTPEQLSVLAPNIGVGGVDFQGEGTVHFPDSPPTLPIIGPTFAPNTTWAWDYTIPLSELPECFIVVAYARITYATNQWNYKAIFGKSLEKTSGYYLSYCVQTCPPPPPPPPPLGGCETGYAYGGNYANCFIGIPGVTSNNWGWSNGPISAGVYDWPIYAGAGQCELGNGTHVGTLTVNFTPPTATITYSVIDGYVWNATHLYVGSLILPKKNGKFTTAPGQFPYKHENLNGASTDTYSISGLPNNIYVAAHSEVCDGN